MNNDAYSVSLCNGLCNNETEYDKVCLVEPYGYLLRRHQHIILHTLYVEVKNT